MFNTQRAYIAASYSNIRYNIQSRITNFLHCGCGTEIEEVPQKWILNFSTSIQVLHNESIGMTSAGSPWLRYAGFT